MLLMPFTFDVLKYGLYKFKAEFVHRVTTNQFGTHKLHVSHFNQIIVCFIFIYVNKYS